MGSTLKHQAYHQKNIDNSELGFTLATPLLSMCDIIALGFLFVNSKTLCVRVYISKTKIYISLSYVIKLSYLIY